MDAPFPAGMLEEIALYLHQDDAPRGEDRYPGVFQSQRFFPLQRQEELAAMIRLARSRRPRVVMEIGADKGGSLYHWVKCLPTVERAIGYEIRGTPYQKLFEDHFRDVGFFWGETSQGGDQELRRLGAWLGYDTIDVLFIDGCKLSMEKDFDRHLPFLTPGGLVFFHDVQDREPREAYWRVRGRGYDGQIVVNLADTQRALERMHTGIPAANPHEEWLRHWRGRSCGVGVVYLGSDNR